jgi:hypothetical protein
VVGKFADGFSSLIRNFVDKSKAVGFAETPGFADAAEFAEAAGFADTAGLADAITAAKTR